MSECSARFWRAGTLPGNRPCILEAGHSGEHSNGCFAWREPEVQTSNLDGSISESKPVNNVLMIEGIFALARETIPCPASLCLTILPCAPGETSNPITRVTQEPGAGEQYSADTVWVASMESDGSEEAYGEGATPEEALLTLRFRFQTAAHNRIAALKQALGDTP